MPLRMAITKQTAQGEQFVVDVCQWNPVTGEICHENMDELTQLADEALKLGDCRVLEMNTRMLEAYALEQYFTPAVWARVIAILDIFAGRQTADTVARRWQSEREETEELEQARMQHALQASRRCNHVSTNGHTLDMYDPLGQVCDACKSVAENA